MANEGTEGFANLNTGSGKGDTVMGQEDYLTKGINKVLKARQMAQEERAYAEREAAEQGLTLDELGFGKNHFMMKSLGHEFGGDFIEQQVQKKKWLKSGKRFKLGMQKFAKDLQQQTVEKLQKSSGIGGENVKIDKESQSRLRKSLWKNTVSGDYTSDGELKTEVPDEVEPNDKLVPDTLESTAKAASGKSTKVTREDILNSLMEISKSLGQTAASINQNVSSNSALASSVSELNSGVISSLSERTDGIEKRLEDIAAAIKNQTAKAVQIGDQKEDKASEDASEETMKDQVDTVAFDNLSTLEDESEETVEDQVEDAIKAFPAVSDEGGGEPPKAEHGGLIVSGDKDGYPYDLDPNIPGPEVELHGTEKLIPTPEGIQVIPIDNNATDGIEGNEETPGGDIGSPPKAEMGGLVAPVIQNSPPPKSPESPVVSSSTSALSSPSPTPRSTTPKTGIVKLPKFETGGVFGKKSTVPIETGKKSTVPMDNSGTTNSGDATKMAQPVMDAMSLPMMVAGGTILSASSQLKGAMGPISSPVSKEIDSFSRPVADIFGLPNTLTKKAMATSSMTSGGLGGDDGWDNGDFFKGLFGNKKNNSSANQTTTPNPNAGRPFILSGGAKGVLDLIAAGESGGSYDIFNTSRGGTPGKATEKTIQWLQDHAKGAIGRYQHMPRYIMKRALAAGYTADTLFTPDVQDAITIKMLETGHGLRDYLSGKQSAESFAAKLAPTWRALPQGPDAAARLGGTKDSTYHDKDRGDNKAGKEGWDNTVASLRLIQAGGNPTSNNTQNAITPTAPSSIATQPTFNPPTFPGEPPADYFMPYYRNSTTGQLYKYDGFGQDGKRKWKAVPEPQPRTASLNNPSPTSQPPPTAFVVPSQQQQRPPIASTAPVSTESGVYSTILEYCGTSLSNYYGGTCAAAIHGA